MLQRQLEVEREINYRLRSRPQYEATAKHQGNIIAELQIQIQGLRKELDSAQECRNNNADARDIALNERDNVRHSNSSLRRIVADMRERLDRYRCNRTVTLQALARARQGNYQLRVAAQRLTDYLYPQGEWRGWSNINGEILPLASDLFRALKSESQCEPEPVNPRLTMMLEEDKRLAAEIITDCINPERRLTSWLKEPVKVTGAEFRRNVDMQRAGS